jgi:hypothetical protein
VGESSPGWKGPADLGLGAQDLEGVRGQEGPFVALGLGVLAGEVGRAGIEAGELLEGGLSLAPVEEVVDRDLEAVDPLGRMVALEVHEAVGLLDGQVREGAVDDAVHRGGEPDAEGQGEDRHGGERGAPA